MTKDESQMIKKSPDNYFATNVFGHWSIVKSQMEGTQGTWMDWSIYSLVNVQALLLMSMRRFGIYS